MEAARNNALLHAQSDLLSSYRDQLHRIEERLNDANDNAHHSPDSTAVTEFQPAGTETSDPQDSTSSSHVVLQTKSEPLLRRKFRTSLPRWFTNCVWEFGMCEAGNGWIFQLRPIQYCPNGTFAFDVVRCGSILAVRKLLASGELGLGDREIYDYTPDGYQDILSVCTV